MAYAGINETWEGWTFTFSWRGMKITSTGWGIDREDAEWTARKYAQSRSAYGDCHSPGDFKIESEEYLGDGE
jgi:hypothetical protein